MSAIWRCVNCRCREAASCVLSRCAGRQRSHDSTEILWRRYVDGAADAVLLHARADRRLRTEKLCERLVVLHQGVFILAATAVCRCLSAASRRG